jgi:hypothetical protein
MYLYDNKQFSQINEIRENYNLISFQDIMRSSGAGVRPVSEAMRKMKIKPEVIILKPSNKTNQLYKREYLPQIVEAVGTKKRTDVIPEGYISKKQFAIKFGVNPYTVNNMGSYFPDFNKYAEYFYIDNIKTKYFLMTEESEKFYAEKVEKYTTPFSKRKHFIKTNLENNREYSDGNLHKIAFDYDILSEIFDTKSRFFQLMIKVYKKYAKLQIADSTRMDRHHIIPRFYSDYANTEDLENTIYLTREVHLLIHILEYRCAFPDYQTKFFTSFCILAGRVNPSNLNPKVFNDLIDTLCKCIDIY